MLVTAKTPAPSSGPMWGMDLTLYSTALLTDYCNCYYGNLMWFCVKSASCVQKCDPFPQV